MHLCSKYTSSLINVYIHSKLFLFATYKILLLDCLLDASCKNCFCLLFRLSKQKRHLSPHPNIVAMFSVFTDYVTELQDAVNLYPAALPSRIYPEGEGRNMSLFLLMKR